MGMSDRNFSIITNFGCNKSCYYCAFAKHRLRNVPQEIDFDYLKWCFGRYKAPKVSISGGGDPLYNIIENFLTLKKIIKSSPYVVDLHTNETLWDKMHLINDLGINQIVVTTNEISEMRVAELEALLKFLKVRIVLIYLNQGIDFIERWYKAYSFVPKLTIRECWGINTDFRNIKDLCESKFPRLKFLGDGDYNYYFMPDNFVYEDYQATRISEIFRRGL